MADLLIELFSEEIPARMQAKASDDLKRLITASLTDAGLTFEVAAAYATPRRLALSVTGVPTKTPDISEERRGPSTSAPEKALAGFMRGAGVTRDQLEEREEKKGTFFYAKIEKAGRAATEVIAEAVEAAVRNFPWPKSQRWGAGSLKWVRPLHSIICVFGGDIVKFEIEGVQAGNYTQGHRFMAPEPFTVSGFADYKAKLLDHNVILDPARRATLIADTAQTLASAAGLELVEDRGLLEEVAGLVEWPVPMIGKFDPDFLAVPEEVLILTMKKDQKYFVTRDPATGKLANKFIFAANIEPTDDGTAITQGNQRVLAARLADAKFFWEQDLKGKLDDNLAALEEIVFHKKLGTVAKRVDRIRILAGYFSGLDCFTIEFDQDRMNDAERAAELCKADLVSGMVGEFPSLQGVMGRYYAKEQSESDAVADAIRDHYSPLGPKDGCPSVSVSEASVIVALSEKLDILAGFFAIDQKPTGSKDPYALRRAALGCVRLVVENALSIKLNKAIGRALHSYRIQALVGLDTTKLNQAAADVFVFIIDRLKVQQRDKGVRHDLIDAVFAKGDDDLVRILDRVAALSAALETDDGVNLLAGYKRAANILRIEEKKDGKAYDQSVDTALLTLAEEKSLHTALKDAKAEAEAALVDEDFEKAMAALSTLRAPIDAFFEAVIVNADEADIRANRLALLSEIRSAVNTVADFGLIEG